MNDEVLTLASNFDFADENFRAVVYDDGSMTLFNGPNVVQDDNTSVFHISSKNMKPFVDWLNKRMEARYETN
ncbi:hypothetical protein [Lacticaseibacillus rhamnosus]|uniref:hypothetical protein n=1 Tax=Lacticaseibacillus rhamnosus TaxID=47715 RepID=UPI0007E0709C|nr:hypothetical protein [Lacticaseibacillus rhamnosus]OAU25327.1 hypothetical protein PY91_03120 [Lacticaseibacillus rhamnosus]